ncbi:MAG: hypothetical protein IJU52_03850 [Clostridia bacterium]|nr:hypothetical protein [Clostridia bacterium]
MTDCICASPRGKESTSYKLLCRVKPGKDVLCFPDAAPSGDTAIIAFPLYFDGVPAKTLGSLSKLPEKTKKIYAICNCGYYDARATAPAFSVLNAFCARTGRTFEGGVGIGAGPLSSMYPHLPAALHPHKKTFEAIRDLSYCAEHSLPFGVRYFEPRIPRALYLRTLNGAFRLRAKRFRP